MAQARAAGRSFRGHLPGARLARAGEIAVWMTGRVSRDSLARSLARSEVVPSNRQSLRTGY